MAKNELKKKKIEINKLKRRENSNNILKIPKSTAISKIKKFSVKHSLLSS